MIGLPDEGRPRAFAYFCLITVCIAVAVWVAVRASDVRDLPNASILLAVCTPLYLTLRAGLAWTLLAFVLANVAGCVALALIDRAWGDHSLYAIVTVAVGFASEVWRRRRSNRTRSGPPVAR